MIGLDTGALIDVFKQNISLKKILDETDESFVSTIINYQELLFGLDFDNPGHAEEEKVYSLFFEHLPLLPLTSLAAKKAAMLFRELQKKGMGVGRFDSMIGGILLEHGVKKIITRNARHFERIKELEVISY